MILRSSECVAEIELGKKKTFKAYARDIHNWRTDERIILSVYVHVWHRDCEQNVYSYFEKGCQRKCTRQSRKVLWVVLSSLFFKKNERIARGTMDVIISL